MEPDNKDKLITFHTNKPISYKSNLITKEDYKAIVRNACPTPGACPFMGTANTMCAIAEVLGLTLPGNATVKARSEEWRNMAKETGKIIVRLINEEWRPKDNIVYDSYLNAIKYVMATGGSSNTTFHVPAIATGRLQN